MRRARAVTAFVLVWPTVYACDSEPADGCADAVIDWEGGPSPYRTEVEAVEGFLHDFPELRRFDELEVADGRIRVSGETIGSYSVEALDGGTVGVSGAEWCYESD